MYLNRAYNIYNPCEIEWQPFENKYLYGETKDFEKEKFREANSFVPSRDPVWTLDIIHVWVFLHH